METLIGLGLTNAVTAGGLALAAALIARYTRQPALWYVLWLTVLLRLVAPPLYGIAVPLPDLGSATRPDGLAAVAVTGGALALEQPGMSIDPTIVLIALWTVGSVVVIGFAVAQTVRLGRILSVATPARVEVAARAHTLADRLGLRCAPPTVEVDDRVPPMLWAFAGTVRLILPCQLLDRLDDDAVDTLLAHELAHLRRRDHWVRHLELAALALFWWNPVSWWAIRRVRRAQELCCDRKVAELLPRHRRAYADTLIETARFLSGRRLPLGSPARGMADLSQMKGRIRMIMSSHRHRPLSLPVRLAASAILLGTLAVTPVLTATTNAAEFTGRPIDLALRDADLGDVLATFSKISAVEILVESGVSGTVTATFDQVPWDEALTSILRDQGLTWERSGDQIVVRHTGADVPAPVEAAGGESAARLTGRLDGDDVFRYAPDGAISEPVAIEKTPPRYPPDARKSKITGVVVADLVIDEIGAVRDVLIEESPSDLLSAAAIEALEQWRFAPATMDGEPVAVRYIVTIKFNLQ
jgi:TonB family protein